MKDADLEHRSRGVMGRRTPAGSNNFTIMRRYTPQNLADYTASISKLLHAYHTKKASHLLAAYPLEFAKLRDLPLSLPEMLVVTKKELGTAEVEKLKATVRKMRPGLYGYVVPKPCPDSFASLPSQDDLVNDHKPSEGAGVTGMRALLIVRKLAALFCKIYNPQLSVETATWISENQTLPLGYYGTTYTISKESVERYELGIKRKRGDAVWEEEKKRFVEKDDDKERVTVKTFHSGVFADVAFPDHPGFGSAAAYPDSPGILFPYFDRMLTADSSLVLSVVWDLFLFNLGSSEPAYLATFERLREFLPHAMATKEGAVLSHIYRGIQMASRAGVEIYLVIEGTAYQGFVLYGTGFYVVNKGVKVETVPYGTLQEHLNSLGSHEASLSWICRLLSEKEIDRDFRVGHELGETEEVKPEEVKNLFTLQTQVMRRVGGLSDEEKGDLMRYAQDLTGFPSVDYLPFTGEGLKRFLKALRSEKMITDCCMDVSGEKIFERDFLARLLLLFGPVCPSPNFPGQRYIRIPVSKDEDKLTKGHDVVVMRDGKEVTESRRSLDTLVFRRVSHRDAVVDWRAFLRNGAFGQPSEKISRKKASTYYILTEGRMLDVWREMYSFGKKGEAAEIPEILVNPLVGPSGAQVDSSSALF